MKKIMKIDLPNTIFRVVYVPAGEKFQHFEKNKNAIVYFFDRRYTHTEDGQHITHYYAETLLEDKQDLKDLILIGDTPDWTVDADSIKTCLKWLDEIHNSKDYRRISHTDVYVVTGVNDDILDYLSTHVNYEATGEGIVYVPWEEIVSLSEDANEKDTFGIFIRNIEQKISGPVSTVCFRE